MESKTPNSVLIVDDESINLMVLKRILAPLYTCYTAINGVSALEQAETILPDLILLDILMPDLTGLEVIDWLKSNPLTAKIPVIFITSKNEMKDEEEALALGAADYIHKPFSPAVVKMRVHNQLEILNYMRHIQKISITDELTGVSNRRYFNEVLEKEWACAKAQGSALALILLDVDHFKCYNAHAGIASVGRGSRD